MRRVLGCVMAAIVAWAGSASSQLTGFTSTPTLSDDGTKVSNVIAVDFLGSLGGVQMLLELTEGTILQEIAFGSPIDVAPGSGLAAAAGGLQFDTYFALGDLFSDGPNAAGAPSLGGGAVGIRTTDTSSILSDTTLSQAFNPPGGLTILDRTNFVIAQIALSSDAQGTFRLLVAAGSPPSDLVELDVRDGVILPEPATAGLLGAAVLTLGCRHRRF
ncbi:MAG: hypothetical protein AAGF84_00030 [Planctomycetota bacterium]